MIVRGMTEAGRVHIDINDLIAALAQNGKMLDRDKLIKSLSDWRDDIQRDERG